MVSNLCPDGAESPTNFYCCAYLKGTNTGASTSLNSLNSIYHFYRTDENQII